MASDTSAPTADKRAAFIKSRGLKLPKHPNLITGPLRGALRENRYEARESEAVMRVVRDGDPVIR